MSYFPPKYHIKLNSQALLRSSNNSSGWVYSNSPRVQLGPKKRREPCLGPLKHPQVAVALWAGSWTDPSVATVSQSKTVDDHIQMYYILRCIYILCKLTLGRYIISHKICTMHIVPSRLYKSCSARKQGQKKQSINSKLQNHVKAKLFVKGQKNTSP